ncbi:MAG: HEAT repeat domain-containing protein, partial [Planctomycetota bacterium]|nr:HEAT repeat domain-containing protein [Planctomycetota bacterium]
LILEEAQGNAHGMRGPALRALGPAGYPPQETVPLLVKSLEDPKARCDAVMALGHLRGAARSAMPALQALLKDPDFNVRTRAENAVNLIKYATDDTTPYVPKEEF